MKNPTNNSKSTAEISTTESTRKKTFFVNKNEKKKSETKRQQKGQKLGESRKCFFVLNGGKKPLHHAPRQEH